MCDGNGTIAAAFLRGIGHNHKAYVETSQPAKMVRFSNAVLATHCQAPIGWPAGQEDTSFDAPADSSQYLGNGRSYLQPRHENIDKRKNWIPARVPQQDECKKGAKACMGLQVSWEGPKWEVVAACFSLKGGRSDFLVEKAAELGAFALRPILTVRSPYLGQPPSSMPCHPMCTDPLSSCPSPCAFQRQDISS